MDTIDNEDEARVAEVWQRAEETLARIAPIEAEIEERRSRPREPARVTWDPANPRGLTVGTMNQAEYDAWWDAGKPPLTGAAHLPAIVRKLAPEAPAGDADLKAARQRLEALRAEMKDVGELTDKQDKMLWVAECIALEEQYKISPRKAFRDAIATFAAHNVAARHARKREYAGLVNSHTKSVRENQALSEQIANLAGQLAELKREASMRKKIDEQNLKRKADLLELENALLKAGARSDEARTRAETELIRMNGHAQ